MLLKIMNESNQLFSCIKQWMGCYLWNLYAKFCTIISQWKFSRKTFKKIFFLFGNRFVYCESSFYWHPTVYGFVNVFTFFTMSHLMAFYFNTETPDKLNHVQQFKIDGHNFFYVIIIFVDFIISSNLIFDKCCNFHI